LESSVLCDRTGGHYFAARNHVGARRGISLARVVSVAIGATILPVIGSPIIARAATIEEVARCRAIQINSERWDCFKALKAQKRNAAKAKRDDTPPSQTEDIPKPKPEDVPKTKSEDVPKPRPEDVPKTKSEDVPPAALHGAQEPASDDPASTSSIDHPSVVPGQLVCANQDSLVAAFVAGVVLGASPAQLNKYGCQTIPKDAQVEILERFPSSFQFVRVVKVNVTYPPQPNSRVGYTFEISR
jgi:hypothetical protein